MMIKQLLPLILVELLSIQSHPSNVEIKIFAVSNLDDESARSVVGSEWLAIQEINSNPDLFPNYHLTLQVYDSGSDPQQALLYGLNITQYKNSANITHFPIILGMPWSSLSTTIAPILSAFNMGQISASSTSTSLSDPDDYPYFYRTVSSDALQAKGIVLLCHTFNWTSVAVVYVNDAYGLYLSLGIQASGQKYGISVTSIAISEYEGLTYDYAAQQIQDLNLFIIIIIKNNITPLVTAFDRAGIMRYPYFYIGTDEWITEAHMITTTAGWIGTIPWFPNSLELNEYENDMKDIVNKSTDYYNKLLTTWNYYYNQGNEEHLYSETVSTWANYGYDAVYVLAYAIQEIENNQEIYGADLWDLIHNTDSKTVINILNDIIINKTDFIGTSGHVLFDQVGDRVNGLYLFGNVLHNGTIRNFGYFYQHIDGTITSKLNVNNIVWPSYFNDNNMIPRSHVLIRKQVITINEFTFIFMLTVAGVSILIAMLFIILLICFRKNRVIRSASYRINIIMCIGGIMCYIAVILYGIDEGEINTASNKLHLLCNAGLWMTTISFTMLFIPLFSKTYRLSLMFKNILTGNTLNDKHLLLLILACVLIDIILLGMFALMRPLHRIYVNGSLKTVDEIQQIQYINGVCSFKNESDDVLRSIYGVVLLWKLCELSFGIYTALNVSRIRDVTNFLTRFDETGIQLISILLTVIILCVTMTILLITDLYGNAYYLVVSITLLLIGNIVLWLNIMPRTMAVLTGNEDNYQKSQAQRIEYMIKQQLKMFSEGKSVNLL
eukprot:469103_1